jgi:hypothetical protein
MCCRQSKDVDGHVQVPNAPPLPLVDAFYEQAHEEIFALLDGFILFADSLGARFAAVTLCCGPVFAGVHLTWSLAGRHSWCVKACLVARYVPVTGTEGAPSTLSSVFRARGVRFDHRLLLGDALRASTPSAAHTRTRFRS